MSKERNPDIEDRDWWRRVAVLIGSMLYGWSYRHSASFVDPACELTGKVASILLSQQSEIERLQAELDRIEQYPTSETLAASTKPMQLLAHLARENKPLAQSLLDEFDTYRRYVKGLDDKVKRLQGIAKDHRETAEAYRDSYRRLRQAMGHVLTIAQEAAGECNVDP